VARLVVNGDNDAPAVELFRPEDNYWLYAQMSDRAAAQEVLETGSWLRHIALEFTSADQLTPLLLEEVHRHGWAVACAEAYPQLMVAGALLQWGGDDTDLSTCRILRQQPRRFQVALGDSEVRVSIGPFAGPSRGAGPSDTPLDLRVAESCSTLMPAAEPISTTTTAPCCTGR